MNAKQLIFRLGGPTLISRKIGVRQSAVSNWCARGVPWSKRAILAEMAVRKGIKLPRDFYRVPFWGAPTQEGTVP